MIDRVLRVLLTTPAVSIHDPGPRVTVDWSHSSAAPGSQVSRPTGTALVRRVRAPIGFAIGRVSSRPSRSRDRAVRTGSDTLPPPRTGIDLHPLPQRSPTRICRPDLQSMHRYQ